jgi:hypothetical protein
VLDLDTVLGVSITRNAAGLLLLDLRAPDSVTVDRGAIDLAGAHAALTDVMAAVLGAQGSISANGHRLRAIGVTSSVGSEARAGELVTMLTQFGLENIVAIRPAEAAGTLTDTSQRADAEALLARGAALAVAHHTRAEMEREKTPPSERRLLDPTGVSAAIILAVGALAVLAAMWFGLAPRHADTDVSPPTHQQGAVPVPLQIPTPAGATAAPATESPSRTKSAAPVATSPRTSRRPATTSPATPTEPESLVDDPPNAAPQPPVSEEPAPPTPEPGQGPEPGPGPEPAPAP